jgi:hypothetical protein
MIYCRRVKEFTSSLKRPRSKRHVGPSARRFGKSRSTPCDQKTEALAPLGARQTPAWRSADRTGTSDCGSASSTCRLDATVSGSRRFTPLDAAVPPRFPRCMSCQCGAWTRRSGRTWERAGAIALPSAYCAARGWSFSRLPPVLRMLSKRGNVDSKGRVEKWIQTQIVRSSLGAE